ncbi:MAG: glycoside hydrolase family 75 protein [Verrucomicrobia bacterium]|nr:glycoside hydrolase family 75 protein [Verrucomicrobiota bacterium]
MQASKTLGIRGCMVGALVLLLVPLGCSKKQTSKQALNQESGHPTPVPVLPRKNYDTARLFNGITLKSSVDCTNSRETALGAVTDSNSYKMDITLHVHWPKAATTPADLLAATPEIIELLPELTSLLTNATLSPNFATLLYYKERSLRANLGQLQKLPYRDSLFDCQTILDLSHPATSRRALFIQAIMNVNTDGSDGDRNLPIDRLSSTFQPQTNYRWPKKSDRPNPCLRNEVSQLALAEAELSSITMAAGEKTSLESRCTAAKATIAELKRWSFLAGTSDPFIVLPSFMVGKSAGQPEIGDYAVVIAKGILYPAILGDLGPNSKIGEASLRICREIFPESGADRRPVSRPEVVYLVFPGTAEKPFTSPDYAHWSERCHQLWKEFGGSDTASWHEWSSLEKPWPTPTPTPTPPPLLTPLPTSSPSAETPSQTNSLSGTNPPVSVVPTNSASSPSLLASPQ